MEDAAKKERVRRTRIAAALARVGLADGGHGAGSARSRPAVRSMRSSACACARTIIEHRLTGERRLYPVSPIGQPIMCLADGGYAYGPETSRAQHPGGGPSRVSRSFSASYPRSPSP
jgi:hypothetical protein